MSRVLRIASVPAAHPYVLALEDPAVVRLPDPRPPGAPPGRWWPPVMLDAAWIAAEAARFDLLHLHFGAESISLDRLRAALRALRRAGRPLVITVHDLDHPQLVDQGHHRAQLDLLVPAAAVVLTLTPGAAREIARRWGRHAEVVAHPAVLGAAELAPVVVARHEARVGLHLRDLRPNVDGPGAVAALRHAVAALRAAGRPVTGHVWLHDTVRDPTARDAVRGLCAGGTEMVLREGPRPGDAALAGELAGLDAAVLPYRHGTHSGWLELCWDLGLPVAAPRVGYLAEQHPDPAAVRPYTLDAPGTLTGVLASLLDGAPRAGTADRAAAQVERARQRRTRQRVILRQHREAYAAALAGSLRAAIAS